MIMNTVIRLLLILFTVPSLISANDNVTIEEDLKNFSGGGDHPLWTGLIKECQRDPSIACVEQFAYKYLNETLDNPHDVKLTNFLTLVKNSVDYNKLLEDNNNNFNVTSNSSGTVDFREMRGIDEISRSLHDKATRFLMTHDVELQLPEMMFEGTTLRLSPRSFEGTNGALVKLDFSPKAQTEGRFLKKLKKFISGQLMWALMAILLVIKFLAAKFMFILPSIVGAVAAKKIIMKILLFAFPFLSHIFKMCPYLPHGATKYHHHKHKISHIHLIGGHGHSHGPPHGHKHHKPHGHFEVIAPHADGPPTYVDLDHHHPHEEIYDPYEHESEFYSGGPPPSHHFIDHDRQDDAGDENEVQSHPKKKITFGKPLSPSEIEMMLLKAEKEAKIKSRLQQERLKIQEENSRLQDQLKQAMRLQEKLKQQAVLVKHRVNQYSSATSSAQLPYLSPPPPPPQSQYSQQSPSQPIYPQSNNGNYNQHSSNAAQKTYESSSYVSQTQQKSQPAAQQFATSHKEIVQKVVNKNDLHSELLLQQPQSQPKVDNVEKKVQQSDGGKSQQSSFVQALHEAATITYDPFYSPILDKIDKILTGLKFNDEGCRERLICSMYSNPVKFSPHSNLLSAELSRDSKELQKPTSTNAAVVRFYRYVQAARDGQDKRDCLRLYANCSIDTEQ